MAMELNPAREGRAVVLGPKGRIDLTNSEDFKVALEPFAAECSAGGVAVIVDMSGVDYISSVGLRALMIHAKTAKSQGGRMVLAGLQPMVLEVFMIARFDKVFEILPDRSAALAAVAS